MFRPLLDDFDYGLAAFATIMLALLLVIGSVALAEWIKEVRHRRGQHEPLEPELSSPPVNDNEPWTTAPRKSARLSN